MSVLVIAPYSKDLSKQQDEVDSLVRALPDAVAVTGLISEDRLIEFLDRDYDGIWFSGHGNTYGFQLDDGILSVDDLISYVNRTGASWVVLNACESDELASRLVASTGADLLVVSKEILDTEAWRIAKLIAFELKKHGNMRKAVDNVLKGRVGRHRFYKNEKSGVRELIQNCGHTIRLENKLDEVVESINELSTRITSVEEKIQYVSETLDGVQRKLGTNKKQKIV